MQWHVIAADARTGEDVSGLIEAAPAGEAEAKARQAGYLVSQVVPAASGGVTRPATGPTDPLAELAAAATRPASLPYEPPKAARPPGSAGQPAPPDYWGLRFGSVAFLVFAGLFYLGGLLGLLVALFTLVNSLGYPSTGLGVLASVAQFFLSLWPLAIGALFHAASSACVALRDIARNSFIS